MSEPLIVGIRHHSPACARLVKSLIESQRPRYVLIEGPADFNDRVDELFLAHQLPVAIYSYCQYQDGAAPGRGAWTPFAEFSPEWQALEVLYALWRLDEISGMQGAQILQTTLCATIDRTLWLCESNGRPDEKEFHAHLHSWQALCHILRDLHSGVNLPGVSLSAAVALLERRSQAIHAPALDRGAALGALMRLEHPNASAEAALTMLAQLSPAQSGEALHGLLALARHQLACQPAFIAGFSSHLNQLSEADFINALPDLRAAMAWLPPRERGTLAHQVLEHYQLAQLPVSALQMPLHCPPQAIAHHQQLEQQALASLQNWGVFHV
ncbi:DUF5682 family protein [Escherichia coli]|uniref:DUF5682 family protein n=1 Tax=Escherichia coli TaxID=562 RepID=UPI0015EF035C|nr:DUF5682 family protein [Escherichia coli]MBA4411763.1 hypothetical protein [Escherichia coli]